MEQARHQVFVPITDEMLEQNPALLDQLRPFHIALPCHRSMAEQSSEIHEDDMEVIQSPPRRTANG